MGSVWADCVNGLFESCGGLFVLMNIWRVVKDKTVRGVAIAPTAFFTLWGLWNLYYYPSLGQWVSFGGGIAVVSGNAVWVGLALKYSWRGGRHEKGT
jgi:hypothetical protein